MYKYADNQKLKINANNEELISIGFILNNKSLIGGVFKFIKSVYIEQPYYKIKEGVFKGYVFPENLLTDKI